MEADYENTYAPLAKNSLATPDIRLGDHGSLNYTGSYIQ